MIILINVTPINLRKKGLLWIQVTTQMVLNNKEYMIITVIAITTVTKVGHSPGML